MLDFILINSAGKGTRMNAGDDWPKAFLPISLHDDKRACIAQIEYWLSQGMSQWQIAFIVRNKHLAKCRAYLLEQGYGLVLVIPIGDEPQSSAYAINKTISTLQLIGKCIVVQWADILLEANWPSFEGNLTLSADYCYMRYACCSINGAKFVGGTTGDLLGCWQLAKAKQFSYCKANDFADCLAQFGTNWRILHLAHKDFGTAERLQALQGAN